MEGIAKGPSLPKVTCICATCGRHTLLERSVRFFLEQDYEGEHVLLIYNNSTDTQFLAPELISMSETTNKKIKLIQQFRDSKTGKLYNSLGGIYNDVLENIDEDTDIAVHWDDDDIFLPTHISEGVKGFKKHNKKAYKPKQSYFRHHEGVELMENVLEPSIFIDFKHLKQYGYSLETTAQHHQWLNPLINEGEIVSDPEGKPTLIYNWGDDVPTFKTSGNPHNPSNFMNYRLFSVDHGDYIITPWSLDEAKVYYLI